MDILESIFERIECIVSSQKQADKDDQHYFVRWCVVAELILVLFNADFDKAKARPRLLQLAAEMPFDLNKKRLLFLAG